MNSRRARLEAFVEEKIAEADSNRRLALCDTTSLLRTRLLDSLAILQLAEWIETEVGRPIDLESIDIADRWDTIPHILAFIDEQAK